MRLKNLPGSGVLSAELKETFAGFSKGPKWLLMRKLGRFRTVRSIATFLVKYSTRPCRTAEQSYSLFPDVNVDEAVESLKNKGFYLDINLPSDIVQVILESAMSTPCYANRKGEFCFYYSDKEYARTKYGEPLLFGSYFDIGSLQSTMRKLESDPKLLEIAAKYFETEPVHQRTQLSWSFAREVTLNGQLPYIHKFHYDLDDYRFLKFFFYLTDVDLYSGPHVCVEGSHIKKKLSHKLIRRLLKDKDVINYYGDDSIVTICGKAGFGFVEDTYCLHKGTPPTQRDRLILCIEFGLNKY